MTTNILDEEECVHKSKLLACFVTELAVVDGVLPQLLGFKPQTIKWGQKDEHSSVVCIKYKPWFRVAWAAPSWRKSDLWLNSWRFLSLTTIDDLRPIIESFLWAKTPLEACGLLVHLNTTGSGKMTKHYDRAGHAVSYISRSAREEKELRLRSSLILPRGESASKSHNNKPPQ